ncbi:MAG: LysR family transcriptional regulator [Castellaniella sp.]|uniref:LysR family transcriptional regulator n=1 Tax=Castellaniella sp. TaxID=1955812 RepID=UPI00121801C8|nr:LysR family transcriptional regulator [Castellaniella sp.]TAN30316.1 MAG: LysR family transcriptional regulator [Castellaniella sp.]
MNDIIPISQWQALLAVVDHGGYAQAAEALGKSQSSVSYAIQRLEDQLGLRVFRQQGRRAVPTTAGQVLLQRARLLVEHARGLESAARQLAAGREPLLRVAIDGLFPDWLLLQALKRFSDDCATTRIEVQETVLSGTDEALLRREADLVISPRIPQGFSGEPLLQIRFVAVAAPDHPLNALDRPLEWADLRQYRQLVVRDSGSQRQNAGWLDAEQRWTFSQVPSSIQAACAGMGFAWYPELRIRAELAEGRLKPLPLAEGRHRYAMVYRIFAHPEFPGIACKELATILQQLCSEVNPIPGGDG